LAGFGVPAAEALETSVVGRLLGRPAATAPKENDALLCRILASMSISLSQAAVRSALEAGELKVFRFETPSPDDLALAKRRQRLNKKTATKKLKGRSNGQNPTVARVERPREREVRLELEQDRHNELEQMGVHEDSEFLHIKAPKHRTAEEKKARMDGIRSRKKNRNSKMNRRTNKRY
jgi:hypothetical protein